jgi:ankyrin repeat protein
MDDAARRLIEAVKGGDAGEVARLADGMRELGAVRDAAGRSAVLLAVYHGRRELADLLLARGVRPDVHEAAALGDRARVAALVAADPALATTHAADGATPLHLAAYFGHTDVAECLLAQGADANATARPPFPASLRPIHSAVANRNAEAARRNARLLLRHGASVNVAQEGGYTPLHQAAAHGDAELVALLLDAGADPAARTAAGETAAALAEANGFAPLAERLRGVGAGA